MTPKTIGIILGGILPAVLFGITGVLQKYSNRAGIGTGPYLIVIGISITVVGIGLTLTDRDTTINLQSGLYTALFGLTWGVSSALIAIALRRYGASISQLVPLYNMNTLVAVLIGLFMMGEWKTLSIPKLLAAALLIIVGGVLAAGS
jgi:hypothetical protein